MILMVGWFYDISTLGLLSNAGVSFFIIYVYHLQAFKTDGNNSYYR